MGEARYQLVEWLLFAVLLPFVISSPANLIAEERVSAGRLALPEEECQTDPRENWTEQEEWIWEQICTGRVADFNETEIYGGSLDPNDNVKWPDTRQVTPAFLETILLHEPYRGALTRQGVHIVGVWFKKPLDLSSADLAHPLRLEASRFESDVNLSGLHTPRLVSLERSLFNGTVNLGEAETGGTLTMIGATFKGKLNMNSVKVAGSLFMRGGAQFEQVDLGSAEIGSILELDGSTFAGNLNMNSLEVGGSLLMQNGAEFVEVDLGGAKVGGALSMIGSTFTEKLNMNPLEVAGSLFMRDGAEFHEVDLGSARVGGQLSMIGSTFTEKLNMNSVKVADSLFMQTGAEFEEVDLGSAQIGGQLSMIGSTFTKKLNINSVKVGGSLFMRDGAGFEEVDLISAEIGGNLEMDGSTFAGKLNMSSLEVEGSLLMQSGAEFVEVDFISAEIGSNLGMDGSAFAGKLNMDSLEVEGNLFMRSVTAFTKPLTLIFARIGGTLDLSASTFSSLDLTGTVIQGELRLGSGQHAPTQWQRGSEESNGKPILILRNTQVGALQDLPDAWPDRLELDGFTYDRLGGFARGGPSDIASRDLSWFLTWLQKQENHSPQPYQQLADIMRKAGQEDRANKTLRAGQERGREEAEGIRWLWLTLLKWVIGYGYGYGNFYSLLWVAVFVVIGSLVLKFNTTARVRGIWWRTFYSFDMILPLIRLDERNYKIALEGFARFYFYIHITIGYLLATFFVAGISGLTK
jgi:hypothetical protein